MYFQNNILIEGRLGKTPELKTSKNGKKYSFFSICFNEPKKLTEPNDKGYMYDFLPNFFNLVAWNKTAEKASELEKGECVSVVGKLLQDKWTDKDGQERNQTKILVSSIKPLKNDKTKKSAENKENNKSEYSELDDIPF